MLKFIFLESSLLLNDSPIHCAQSAHKILDLLLYVRLLDYHNIIVQHLNWLLIVLQGGISTK